MEKEKIMRNSDTNMQGYLGSLAFNRIINPKTEK